MQEVLSMTEDSTIRLWDVNRGCSKEGVTVSKLDISCWAQIISHFCI